MHTPRATPRSAVRDARGEPPGHRVVPRGTTRHGLVIGIDRYADPRLNLGCAAADARALYELMIDPACGCFPRDQVTLLLDAAATMSAVLVALVRLGKQAGEHDMVWICFAGHAAVEADDAYWLTHDTDVNYLLATALDTDRISRALSKLATRRIVMLLDCCHAAATAFMANPTRDVVTARHAFGRFEGRGTIALAAADRMERSVELSELGHGAFTHVLVEGLRGAADVDHDGVVTADEIWRYLRGKVTDASGRAGNPQTPVLIGTMTHDLALTLSGRTRDADVDDAPVPDEVRQRDEAPHCLADLLEHPWDARVLRNLPFHFSQSEGELHGRTAQVVLPPALDRFLDAPERARWWLWTGLEGAGKSRLAMHACQHAAARGWDAGFLNVEQLRRQRGRWGALAVERDVLVVIDYVGLDAEAAREALEELTRRRARTPRDARVRVVLLERYPEAVSPIHASRLPAQWVVDLFHSPLQIPHFIACQYPDPGAPSLHLGELSRAEAGALALALARQRGGPDPAAIARDTLEILWPADRPAQARPLHVQLTVFVLSELRDGITTFEEAIRQYLRHRVALRREQFRNVPGYAAEVDQILNLICVATLLRSVQLADVPAHPDLPSKRVLAQPRRLLQLMGQPPRETALRSLEPDLIGEWFVRMWCDPDAPLGGGLALESLTRILDEIPGSDAQVADFVQRTYRYTRSDDGWRSLWGVLRNRLGRYSTPFGKLFDSAANQAVLLGGSTDQAERCYREAVEAAVEETRDRNLGVSIVVDLMAGGAERVAELLRRYGRSIRVLAIDRDISRLAPLCARYPDQLRVLRHQITGAVGLADALREAFGCAQCDVVIAKKALHEVSWPAQEALIDEIGRVTDPGGWLVIYADAPVRIDRAGKDLLRSIVERVLPRAIGGDDRPADHEELVGRLAKLPFQAESESDAAVFANLWIKLKDWANHNAREYANRYFSSNNELLEAFTRAGFDPEARGARTERFTMELQPSRFLEEAINRLSYLYADSTLSPRELASVVTDNPRYAVFWSAVTALLWAGPGPTAFGASPHIRARPGQPFDLKAFVRDIGLLTGEDRLRHLEPAALDSPSFEMPVHVYALPKRWRP